MQVSIIGAGPAGNYLAYLLAKNRINVDIYEEHKKIGLPIQCTGILTDSITNIIKIPDNIIANRIRKFKIIPPSNSQITFNFREPDIIIHRDKFDQYLAKLAKAAGAKYHLNTKYLSNTNNTITIKQNNKLKTAPFNYLIGADGPNSLVAKNNSLFTGRKFIMGQQVIAKLPFPEDEVQIYLGIGDFAWIVPERNKLFRIGLVAKNNSREIFQGFIKKIKKQNKIKIKPLQNQSGIIPIFSKKQKTHNNNVFILGDAAAQIKITSYGGIIHSLLAAQCIADKITKNQSIKTYEKNLKNNVAKDMYYSLIIRKVLNRFTEQDYNSLIRLLQKPEVKSLLEEYERDFPSRFMFKLFLAQPKLIKFAGKLIQ